MKAVVLGAGNIGRGFIGQLLFESGFETVFVDVNEPLINKLNEDKFYFINIVSNDYQNEIKIENIRAVHSSNAEKEIKTADIIFTSVGVNALKHVAPVLKSGLKGRKNGVDIIICENLLHADKYLKDLIKPSENVGFVESSVGRMVPVMSCEQCKKSMTTLYVEPFCTLPVDKAAFKNAIPGIKNMLPFEPFDYYIQSKLYLHNMGHAALAYLAMQRGIEFIYEAMEEEEIFSTVKSAMHEVSKALSIEHMKPLDEVLTYAEDLLFRFKNRYLGDTAKRVAKDTKRKLAPGDRLLGALELCEKHKIDGSSIKKGIIAALDYLYEE